MILSWCDDPLEGAVTFTANRCVSTTLRERDTWFMTGEWYRGYVFERVMALVAHAMPGHEDG